MPRRIKSADALARLKPEELATPRGKQVFERTISQLNREVEALETRIEEGTLAKQEAARLRRQNEGLKTEIDALRETLNKREEEVGELAARKTELDSLREALSARDRLIEELQVSAAGASGAESPPPRAEPRAVIESLYEDLSTMAREKAGSGFELADVEVDLRVPLDLENEKPVMRFARAAMDAPENASRIRFRLTRSARLVQVEEE